jgi:hypothetical protein
MRHWWEQCGLARSARGSALRPDITPGASFPDYQLPDHTDTLRRLSVAYTKIATIATDDHHEIQEFRASVGPSGRSSRTRDASSSATWTSRSTPTRTTIR